MEAAIDLRTDDIDDLSREIAGRIRDDESVLELGCDGSLCKELLSREISYIGVMESEEALERLTGSFEETRDLMFLQKDFMSRSIVNLAEISDVIVLSDVLDRMPHDDIFLSQLPEKKRVIFTVSREPGRERWFGSADNVVDRYREFFDTLHVVSFGERWFLCEGRT